MEISLQCLRPCRQFPTGVIAFFVVLHKTQNTGACYAPCSREFAKPLHHCLIKRVIAQLQMDSCLIADSCPATQIFSLCHDITYWIEILFSWAQIQISHVFSLCTLRSNTKSASMRLLFIMHLGRAKIAADSR